MFEAQNIAHFKNDWITYVFLAILLILSVLKILFNDRLVNTTTFFLSKKNLFTYFNKEKQLFFNLFQILFFIVQLLTFSLLFFFLNEFLQLNTTYSSLKLFFVIAISVSLYFSFRFLLGLFLAYVFNLSSAQKKIAFTKINYFNNLTLCLLPFLFFTAYSKYLNNLPLKITFIIFITLLIIRYTLFITNNKKLIINNLFYFILYICALEIAPLVIILKLIIFRQN
jgi:hypothetical protein